MAGASKHLYVVILAGGTGTRLWPRSRRERPKQLLGLLSTRTMLQQTFDRIAPLLPPDHIFVITNASYVEDVCQQLPEIPEEQVIGEPEGRGTAPPLGFAAELLRRRDPEAVMVSLAADHYIQREAEFREAVCAAQDIASRGFLVTFGIKPSYPETGYGYIEAGAELAQADGWRTFRVKRFVEKPDEETAARFIASGNYSWNGGMFIQRASVLREEFAVHLPNLAKQLDEIAAAHGTPSESETFTRVWQQMANETIDVGIMEKSDRVAVLPLDVGWSDVGNWASLLTILPGDGNRNVVIGDHIGVETSNSLIYSNSRLIATVGLSDMIVVDTDDIVLVCHKEDAQKVKHLVEELKKSQLEKYL
jgi:mannose-1-phosphate guanylyltransferase